MKLLLVCSNKSCSMALEEGKTYLPGTASLLQEIDSACTH